MRTNRLIAFLFLIVSSATFILNVSGQSTFQASVTVDQSKITQCQSINDNANILNQLNATNNCLTFSINNVVLNCSGFRINGADENGIGINITNRNNITIKNCLIANFSLGIFIKNGSDIFIENVIILDISEDDDDHDIESNDTTNILLVNVTNFESRGKNIQNYNFTNTTQNNMSYSFANVTSILFQNVQSNSTTITASNSSITYAASTLNNVTVLGTQINITINGITFINGTIEINSSDKNTHFEHSFFENSNLIVSNVLSLNITNTSMSNTTLRTNTTILSNVSFENNTKLIVSHGLVRSINSVLGLISFTNTNLSIFRENTSELNFTNPLTGTTNKNLSSLITLKNESIQVNSSASSFLNSSAKLLFYPQNFTNIEAKIDVEDDGTYEQCPTSVCENGTTTQTNFVFDVAHFTSFSFGGSQGTTSTGSGTSASGGKSGGGGEATPIIHSAEISPEYIKSVINPGESQEFIVTLKAGSTPLNVDVVLHAPFFMLLNDGTQRYSLSLPREQTWKIFVKAVLPLDAQGVYEAELILKSSEFEKVIPLHITVPALSQQPLLEQPIQVSVEKKVPSLLARQPRLKKILSYIPISTFDSSALEQYANALRTWTILLGIILIIFIVVLISITEPHALHELMKIIQTFFTEKNKKKHHIHKQHK